MDTGDALGTAAQVAAGLAGFAGVVVAFRAGSLHEWSAVDQFRLRLLLGNSVLPFIFSLIGLFLLVVPGLPSLWQWASGISVAALVPFGINMGKSARRIPRDEFPKDAFSRWVFYPLGILAWIFVVLQVYNAAYLGAFWPFFGLIVFQLSAAALQFVRLILLPGIAG